MLKWFWIFLAHFTSVLQFSSFILCTTTYPLCMFREKVRIPREIQSHDGSLRLLAQTIDYVNTKFSHSCLQWSTTFLAAEPQPKMIGTRIAWSLCWAISSASLRNWMKEVKVRKSQKYFFWASNPFYEGFTALVSKGQLISKCLLGIIVSTNNPSKLFSGFLP